MEKIMVYRLIYFKIFFWMRSDGFLFYFENLGGGWIYIKLYIFIKGLIFRIADIYIIRSLYF